MEAQNHDKTVGKCDCTASCNCNTTASTLAENVTVKLEPKSVKCNDEIVTSALNLLTGYGSDDSSSNSDKDMEILNETIDCPLAGDICEAASVTNIISDKKLAKHLINSQINKLDSCKISDSEDDSHSLESDDDDDDEPNYRNNYGTSEDLPLIDDLKINVDEADCDLFGKIKSIVGNLVVVEPFNSKKNILNLDTVLFLDKGKTTLGLVFDVIGNIASPEYCIRFNSVEDIKKRDIKINLNVYIAPKTEHTKFVIVSELMKDRGSDASWEHDIEPPEKCKEFSDDESEYKAKAERKYQNSCKKTQMKNNLNDPNLNNNSNSNMSGRPPTSTSGHMPEFRPRQPSSVYRQNNQFGFRHPARNRFSYRPHGPAYRQPHYYPYIPNEMNNYNNHQMFNPVRPSFMFPPPHRDLPPPAYQRPSSQFQLFHNMTHAEAYNTFAAPTANNNAFHTDEK